MGDDMGERTSPQRTGASIQRALAGAADLEDFLRAVVDQAETVVGVEGSYAIATLLYGAPLAVATSDRDAWDADQVEFDTDSGPCVEALREGVTTNVEDLRQDQRWPAWAAVAATLGFRSAAAVPVAADGQPHRLTLNFYSRTPAAYSQESLRRGEEFLTEVAEAIPVALRIFDQSRTIDDLQAAMAGRSTIDQALGVLMAQNRCTREEAFGILRRASQNRNVKLRDVAAAIIARYTGHQAPPAATVRLPSTDQRG